MKGIVRPGIAPRFKIATEEKIFTIGSCFARNIENRLVQLGYRLRAREMWVKSGLVEPASPTAILNNYAVSSILNELDWAFGEEPKLDDISFEVSGRLKDLHLPMFVRPADAETFTRRRKIIRDTYRLLVDSSLIIITLGLVEAWFDKKSGRYTNTAPLPRAIKAEPGRFELHVQSIDEIRSTLHEIVARLGDIAPAGHKILMTVSPVPLTSTWTERDVMIANCYSKSALRAAAEEMYYTYDHIDYYPSYESITLSDRSGAYLPDEVHVTDEAVRTNVDRMLAYYTDDTSSREIKLLRAADMSAEEIVTELEPIVAADPNDIQATIVLLRAKAQLDDLKDEAATAARALTGRELPLNETLELCGVLFELDDPESVVSLLDKAFIGGHIEGNLMLARACNQTGRHERAVEAANRCPRYAAGPVAFVALEKTKALVELNKMDEASDALRVAEDLRPQHPEVLALRERIGRPAPVKAS